MMPDSNKHAALAADGFKIQPTCSTCVHWSSSPRKPPLVGAPPRSKPEKRRGWGRCAVKPYQHEKHTEEKKAGTPAIGYCHRYGQDLRSIEMEAGDDYVLRYIPDAPLAPCHFCNGAHPKAEYCGERKKAADYTASLGLD